MCLCRSGSACADDLLCNTISGVIVHLSRLANPQEEPGLQVLPIRPHCKKNPETPQKNSGFPIRFRSWYSCCRKLQQSPIAVAMRPVCAGCARPVSVCLCTLIPSPPFRLRTRLLILQHPHEKKQKLATVPVLARCVQPCHMVVGRRLHSCNWPFDGGPLGPTILLFPGLHATELQPWHDKAMAHGEWVETVAKALPQGLDVIRTDDDQNEHNDAIAEQMSERFSRTGSDESLILSSQAQIITLVVVDGTWEHAQEMVKASLPFLSPFITQVCLPFDIHSDGHGVGESDLIIRKEPFGGCVSTMEAVARALAILEPDGDLLETQLMEVLRKMVSLQASHFGTPKIRTKVKKPKNRGPVSS